MGVHQGESGFFDEDCEVLLVDDQNESTDNDVAPAVGKILMTTLKEKKSR